MSDVVVPPPEPVEPMVPRRVYRRENLEDEVRARRRAVADYWRRFPAPMRFLQDTMPTTWEEISRCRMTYKYHRLRGSEWFKLTPYACWQQPWCIHCVKALNNRRVKAALDAFAECTPRGRPLRFIGITQTAPLTAEGLGWGGHAYQDPGRFLKVVWRLLQEMYGPGLGVQQSFQAFGEKGPKKWHPHSDLTVNGFRIVDGHAEPLPAFDLSGGGRKRWDDAISRIAQEEFPEAIVNQQARPGRDLFMLEARVGVPAYYAILRYKMREMWDVRKFDYSREKRSIYWVNYTTGERTPYTIEELFYAVGKYQRLYGSWGASGTKRLHRRYGHMSDVNINYTAHDVGGAAIPHGSSCPCSECLDWDRVFLDDVDRAVGPARPVRL